MLLPPRLRSTSVAGPWAGRFTLTGSESASGSGVVFVPHLEMSGSARVCHGLSENGPPQIHNLSSLFQVEMLFGATRLSDTL